MKKRRRKQTPDLTRLYQRIRLYEQRSRKIKPDKWDELGDKLQQVYKDRNANDRISHIRSRLGQSHANRTAAVEAGEYTCRVPSTI